MEKIRVNGAKERDVILFQNKLAEPYGLEAIKL